MIVNLEDSPFNMNWSYRTEKIAPLITSGSSVLDLGCGTQHIKEYVNFSGYTGVDFTPFSHDVIMCDLNNIQKLDIPRRFDLIIAQGIIEYIEAPFLFLKYIRQFSKKLIVTFYQKSEPMLLWKTPLRTFEEFEKVLESSGWKIITIHNINNEKIYECEKK